MGGDGFKVTGLRLQVTLNLCLATLNLKLFLMFCGRLAAVNAGEFIGKLLRFVNQHRQALRADEFFFTFE
jgi:hypothetical protein